MIVHPVFFFAEVNRIVALELSGIRFFFLISGTTHDNAYDSNDPVDNVLQHLQVRKRGSAAVQRFLLSHRKRAIRRAAVS